MPRHIHEDDIFKGPEPPEDPTQWLAWLRTGFDPAWLIWNAGLGDWVEFGGGVNGGGGGGSGSSQVAEMGTYDGTGLAWGHVLTLDEPCEAILVSGYPSGGMVVQAYALRGGQDAIRIRDDGGSYSLQLRLLADGVTVEADGTGSAGLNETGTTYEYVAIRAEVGGGGAVPGWITHLAEPDHPVEFADEFDGEEMLPGWTEVTASGSAVWQQRRGLASVRFWNQGAASFSALLFPYGLPIGSCVETFVRILGPRANHIMTGPIVTDGVSPSSGAVQLMPYTTTNWSLRAGTIGNIGSTLQERAFAWEYRGEAYMRLIRSGENEWHQQGSPDGVSWMDFDLTPAAFTLSPTHVGLGVSTWGNSWQRIASFEYLRVHDMSADL